MKLSELLVLESPDEDRALISLSSAIYKYISRYINTDIDYSDEDQELMILGKLGDLFDTPLEILNNITLELQGGEPFLRRAESQSADRVAETDVLGLWDFETKTLTLNLDYLDHKSMRTIITHELRHALDDYKSKFKASYSKSYSTPKHQQFRKSKSKTDPIPYLAQPAEINARFSEVMDTLINIIPRRYKTLPPSDIKHQLKIDLLSLLNKHRIAEFFPTKDKSPDYKRLIKRGMSMLEKEMYHYEQTGTDKKARGNW